ncbi:hypothetical protein ACF9IK_34565 [Kitasatospora hibisci]|uniref:Mu transposase domain-containing protein n=1 Tax=Kitasatospora hibisci TaxID=3369522 RepID=UPI0037548ECD
MDTNDYSVHPHAISRLITVRAVTEEITVTCGEDVAARHARCWARHQSITGPEHVIAARHLRERSGSNGPPTHASPRPRSWHPTASASRSNSASWPPTTVSSPSSRAEPERGPPDDPNHRPHQSEHHHRQERPSTTRHAPPAPVGRPPPTSSSSPAQ